MRRGWFGALFAAIAAAGLLASSPAGRASDPSLPGIDVSHHQGVIDWPRVAADARGIRFVIARASYGDSGRDRQFRRNRLGAAGAGLPLAAYHFAYPSRASGDAIKEADNFLSAAGIGAGDLIPALDLEWDGLRDAQRMSAPQLISWASTWLERVRERTGVRAMIYSSPSFWSGVMDDTRVFAREGHRLWIAHWGVSSPRLPAAGWGGAGWSVWQYGNCGRVGGIRGCVDTDRVGATGLDLLFIRRLVIQVDGSGVVEGPGVTCVGPATCTFTLESGAEMALAARAAGGVFATWTGDCVGPAGCSVRMDRDRAVRATFLGI